MQDYCQVIITLCSQDMAAKALGMASSMVGALAEKDRQSDARRLAQVAVAQGAHNDGLAKQLWQFIEAQDGEQDWFAIIKQKSGVVPESLNGESLSRYDTLRRYTKGHVVYHRSGWGEGVVEAFDCEAMEISIRFASGRNQEISFSGACDSMQPLAEDDLRSMRMLAQEELERLAKESPSQLIRKAATIQRGRINSSKVKEALCPSVIPTKKWNTFWKNAKAAAAHDPWLQVEGSTTRPIFVLRKKPLSLTDEASRAINHSDDLADGIRICQEYLGRCHDANARDTILDVAQRHVEAALSAANETPAHILDGILMLAENNRETSIAPAEELRVLLYPEPDQFTPEKLDELSTQQSKDHAITLLPQALGDDWANICVNALTRFPAEVVESVVQKLQDDGQAQCLLQLWSLVAPFPRRHPMLTYLMGRLYGDGIFEGMEGAPNNTTVGRVLLHLCRTLSADRRGSQQKARLLTRLTSLLVGRRDLLKTILAQVDRDACANFLGITERGGSDFPSEISAMVLRTVASRFPDITAKAEKQFWELDNIYVTKAGLERQQEDYRNLVEEKIPANSKAIGVAASHGDLSENSEWDAAMEEQRNLTGRATLIDEDLRKAKLIEEQDIPQDLVAPGNRITVTNLDDNSSQTFNLLGPWDAVDENTMNYLAPLGQALLGKRVDEVAVLESADGEREIRIDSIERIG